MVSLELPQTYYGISHRPVHEVEGGWTIELTVHLPPPVDDQEERKTGTTEEQGSSGSSSNQVSFQAYILQEGVFGDAAKEIGMVDIGIEKPTVAPSFEGDKDEEHWKNFMEKPLFNVMTAVKV